jgi:hypothetical protein
MHLKSVTALLAFSIVTFSPALPILDLSEMSAAHANGNSNGPAFPK